MKSLRTPDTTIDSLPAKEIIRQHRQCITFVDLHATMLRSSDTTQALFELLNPLLLLLAQKRLEDLRVDSFLLPRDVAPTPG